MRSSEKCRFRERKFGNKISGNYFQTLATLFSCINVPQYDDDDVPNQGVLPLGAAWGRRLQPWSSLVSRRR